MGFIPWAHGRITVLDMIMSVRGTAMATARARAAEVLSLYGQLSRVNEFHIEQYPFTQAVRDDVIRAVTTIERMGAN